jgi:foldase protein PrsA
MTARTLFVVLALALVSVGALAQQPAEKSHAPGVADPVATVNGKPITQDQYRSTLIDWFGKEVFEEMIQAETISQAAERAKVVVTDEQVDKRLALVQSDIEQKAATGQGPTFAQWMASRRVTIANLRSRLRSELQLEGLVADDVKVTTSEAQDFYDKNQKAFAEPERVKISVITVKTEDEANKVRTLINSKQKNWGDASREFNINPYTAKTGGDVGYCVDDGSPIATAAFGLKADLEISAPVSFQGAFHLVRREDRQKARIAPFDEVKQSIVSMLLEQRLFEAKMKKRTELRNQAVVQRFVEFQEAAPTP